ncbi:hypothetical protein LX36DRAFT_683315 [Colletotrichum falcatum]|nr:hypothetical protein LX36DRAFT_683315 [Colletotrichum falcatum]
MDYHSAVLADPKFLALMQDAARLPDDLDTLKTWYFTRLVSVADRLALLGVYGSLVADLGVDRHTVRLWLANLELHANVRRLFDAEPERVTAARRRWFAERGRAAVFRCDRFGRDTPVFRFGAVDADRKKWPAEWRGLRRADIELAVDATEGCHETGFRDKAEREVWLVEMARRWRSGRDYVHPSE